MADSHPLEDELEIEAYCVSCKEKRVMDNPTAVWTSQGRPGTRGTCSVCGGNIFRMGRTELHGNSEPPKPVQVVPAGAKGRAARAAYIAADATQAAFANQLAEELRNIGVNVWVDSGQETDSTQWSTGVHPALEQCTHLVMVLSSFSVKTAAVEEAWTYFLKKRKPIIVAQIEATEPPDRLRTRPRFDFESDHKQAFRGLVEFLSR